MLWPIILASVGYILALVGTYLVVRGTPPDVGIGIVPMAKGNDEAEHFFARQDAEKTRRKCFTRWGLGLLLAGTVIQLLGYLWGVCSMPKP
jgi:hypothetical protein